MYRNVINTSNYTSNWLDVEGCIYNQKDSQAILNLYNQYGVDCVKYVNGDFAFVLYDIKEQILFGAVDRLGAKTLYYHFDKTGFEYSTALLPLCKGKNYTIDSYARQCYFSMQYIPSPHTIISEIKKLSPGTYFTFALKTGVSFFQ